MNNAPVKVLIAGGGVAALEALMALRELAEERVSLELVTPTPEFAYRPLAVAEPFGLGNVRRYDVVRMAADHGAAVHIGSVKSVDTETRQILTWEGRGLPYDLALIAIGARAATSIPGSVTLRAPATPAGSERCCATSRSSASGMSPSRSRRDPHGRCRCMSSR